MCPAFLKISAPPRGFWRPSAGQEPGASDPEIRARGPGRPEEAPGNLAPPGDRSYAASMHLILASTSPYRRALLERLGVPFAALSPIFLEQTPDRVDDPRAMVVANALGKARSLVPLHPGAIVIGSDQAAVCEGRVLGKPGTVEQAVTQLLQLSGREHELLTAVAVIGPSSATRHGHASGTIDPGDVPPREETALAVNQLRMRPLSAAEARAYVLREQPLDCAGAYKSEGLGIALFESIRGDDPTAVVGLPLVALCELLRRFGIDPLLSDHPGDSGADRGATGADRGAS
jgi:septum formation protein